MRHNPKPPAILRQPIHGELCLLHGSRAPDLEILSSARATPRRPFGPAVYLTADALVASCYTGFEGCIYQVVASGHFAWTVDVNQSFAAQSVQARQALVSAVRRLGLNTDGSRVRSQLGIWYERSGEGVVNRALRDAGIWMLYGTLDGDELAGLKDRGVQYAVINDSHLQIAGHYAEPPRQRSRSN